jgi:hypothetical protein
MEEGLEAYVVRHGTDGIGLEWLEPNSRALVALLENAPTLEHERFVRSAPASVELPA